MYVLTVEDHFASAHQLRGYKGKCENIHGHNWKIVVSVQGTELNDIGLLIDFHEIKAALKDVFEVLDHKNLNDVQYFKEHNPSSENIARYIAEQMEEKLAFHNEKVAVESVTVWESHTSRCTYKP